MLLLWAITNSFILPLFSSLLTLLQSRHYCISNRAQNARDGFLFNVSHCAVICDPARNKKRSPADKKKKQLKWITFWINFKQTSNYSAFPHGKMRRRPFASVSRSRTMYNIKLIFSLPFHLILSFHTNYIVDAKRNGGGVRLRWKVTTGAKDRRGKSEKAGREQLCNRGHTGLSTIFSNWNWQWSHPGTTGDKATCN